MRIIVLAPVVVEGVVDFIPLMSLPEEAGGHKPGGKADET